MRARGPHRFAVAVLLEAVDALLRLAPRALLQPDAELLPVLGSDQDSYRKDQRPDSIQKVSIFRTILHAHSTPLC